MARANVRGRLFLQNPLKAKSDTATAEYQLNVLANDLATFTPNAVTIFMDA